MWVPQFKSETNTRNSTGKFSWCIPLCKGDKKKFPYSGRASFPHSQYLNIKTLYDGEEWKTGAAQVAKDDFAKQWDFCREIRQQFKGPGCILSYYLVDVSLASKARQFHPHEAVSCRSSHLERCFFTLTLIQALSKLTRGKRNSANGPLRRWGYLEDFRSCGIRKELSYSWTMWD